jgi:hypothetical protein
MTPESINHNVEFIERCKPCSHPTNKHLLAIDMRGLPRELCQDIQQALLELGVRYHLQSIQQGQLLCLDRASFEMLQQINCPLNTNDNVIHRAAVAE